MNHANKDSQKNEKLLVGKKRDDDRIQKNRPRIFAIAQ